MTGVGKNIKLLVTSIGLCCPDMKKVVSLKPGKGKVVASMWVHRRSEEPSSTSITSYWKKPRLSAVGTSTKFIIAANFSKTSGVTPPSTSVSCSTFMEQIVAIRLRGKVPWQILNYAPDVDKLSTYKQ
ncbi:hypothetical protein JTB14_003333 [Gonioctena quinquepunctata]|nr:hypothetical protein JTB14_003333 [Gonioctena quinquepunctata]